MARLKLRLWPGSLLGQTLLALAAALLVAQSVSAMLLWRAAQGRMEQTMLNTAAFRLIGAPRFAHERSDWPRPGMDQRIEGQRRGGFERGSGAREFPMSLRVEHTMQQPIRPSETRMPDREQALRQILAAEGLNPVTVLVTARPLASDPLVRSRPRLLGRATRAYGPRANILVAAIQVRPGGEWSVARVALLPRRTGTLRPIILQTALIFVFLLTMQYLVLRRITRPLKLLTTRTEHFARTQEPSEPLGPRGPVDIRQLILAHNAMETRIAGLLDEKDVMLGAIGHDLKTPLAALRVRIESVEDDAERSKMAASIEDITRSLDDILSLARVGRASDPPERTELSALAASVVEEFEDMGEPVSLGESSRIVLPVHVTWMRRALRNLISNAVRYGKSAKVNLLRDGPEIVLRVEDTGPGIADDRIGAMLEPFTRGETSRNRDTGGAGLGLTLARAIAEQHGGRLVLINRKDAAGKIAGLGAELRLPAG